MGIAQFARLTAQRTGVRRLSEIKSRPNVNCRSPELMSIESTPAKPPGGRTVTATIKVSYRKRDLWAHAVCRKPEHHAWAVEHRGSRWDYEVPGETKLQRAQRHADAQRLCLTCPLRAQCADHHAEVQAAETRAVSGVWGGRIHNDRLAPVQAAA